MPKKSDKKKLIVSQHLVWLFLCLFVGSFLFGENSLAAIPNDYNKNATSTLTAAEWNHLTTDFVNTWQTAFMVGPLGIGTTGPGYKLDVRGDSGSANINIQDNSLSAGFRLIQTAAGLAYFRHDLTTGNLRFEQNGSGFIDFYTGGASRLTVLGSGNVGIGTTTPNNKLQIDGGPVQVINVSGGQIGGLASTPINIDQAVPLGYLQANYLSNSSASSSGWLLTGNSVTDNNSWLGSISNYDIAFRTNNLERMRILKNGNVGIGTTGPKLKLEASGSYGFPATSGTTQTGVARFSAPGTGNVLDVGVYGIAPWGAWLQVTDSGGLNVTNPLSLNPNGGNVGIGTTNPIAKLDISGALKFGDTTDACDVNHSGAFKYNATSNQTYLCDGKQWRNTNNCGLMTDDAGQTYGTVQIGGQCWMAENINIGTMLVSGTTEPVTTNNIIEKWCYNNDPAQCAQQGGLYNYNEAMRGSQTAGARGICASGWHIPTDAEYNKLEKTILGIIASPNTQYVCDFSVAGWQRCADNINGDQGGAYGAGKSLKAIGQGSSLGAGNDLAGFGGKLSGYRYTDGSYGNLGWYLLLWSSTPSGPSNAWYRRLYSSYSTVYRNANARAGGFSVRCLRD